MVPSIMKDVVYYLSGFFDTEAPFNKKVNEYILNCSDISCLSSCSGFSLFRGTLKLFSHGSLVYFQ